MPCPEAAGFPTREERMCPAGEGWQFFLLLMKASHTVSDSLHGNCCLSFRSRSPARTDSPVCMRMSCCTHSQELHGAEDDFSRAQDHQACLPYRSSTPGRKSRTFNNRADVAARGRGELQGVATSGSQGYILVSSSFRGSTGANKELLSPTP